MRAALIFFVVLLLAFAGYAYYRDPAGVEKMWNDAGSIATSGFEKLRKDAGPVATSLSPMAPRPDAASRIAPLIEGKLISADGSPFAFPAKAPAIQYYALYYSARWCPPCHAFTPVLVEWYRKFKPSHSNFELIFVSDDHDKASMLAYMKEMAMPWPAFAFDDLKHDGKGIEKFAGTGIPDLVLVDADGKVLSDSFSESGSYLGPRHVLDDMEKLVPLAAPASPVQPAAAAPALVPISASTSPAANPPAPPVLSPTTAPVPTAPPPPVTPAPVAAAPVSASAPTIPSPDANKPWAPPEVMPAQPNWTWATSDGKTYQNVVVTKIEPDTVSITHSMGAAHIPIILLPPDIQKQLNYNPHAASQLFALIDGKLVSADGTAASAPGPSVQYYAIYYSAQWCPPCHAFSPRLVKWYNAFKPAHPNFELIFVSEDHNAAAMLDYMKEMAMPWPAVRFGDLQHDGRGTFRGSGIEKFAGAGIPDLVLVDADGKVWSDSYQNGQYVGPETVVDDINKLLGGAAPVPLVRQAPSAPAARPVFISARDW